MDAREARYIQFKMLKKKVKRLFPNAVSIFNECSGWSVQDGNGNNILRNYPDLCHAKDCFSAWKNVSIVGHWNKIEARNIKKSRIDVKNVVGNTSNMPKKEGWEYNDNNVSNTGEVYDEANQYSNN